MKWCRPCTPGFRTPSSAWLWLALSTVSCNDPSQQKSPPSDLKSDLRSDEDESGGSSADEQNAEEEDARDGESEEQEPVNRRPRVSNVTILPSNVYVDGQARCSAEVSDPDGDPTTKTYVWENASRGRRLGSSQTISLSPATILPGETLTCTVEAEDPDGAVGTGTGRTRPVCGMSDLSSLDDVNFHVSIYFRPWTTDELQPDWGGHPWDWNGSIPDEIFSLANDLDDILTLVNHVYPTPELITAQEVLDQLVEIGYFVDATAPMLLDETVPPDPDIYPYMMDSEYGVYPFWDLADGGWWWQDSYEVHFTMEQVDLNTFHVFAFDIEDIDLITDDNMGDYLQQGDNPVMLSWELFAEGAYCTSTIYNPTDYAQSSDVAYVPSSILYMAIEVY
ncbi:MAG TPA: hypothetical protein DFR83_04160 [Deltaproteobacteria bacterium]|nr:hypothetical protein [Deltaproteobacteria bacterium]|tara:strand:+ start:201 stop:1376 length:1176 start_codon:yes stop_codon:yes gene_type:complete